MLEDEVLDIEPIARFRSGADSPERGMVVFESKYRDPDALRGIDSFSHLWLVWGASEDELALSVVRLEGVERTKGRGHALDVSQADLPDKAPIFDIKPYLPFADAHLC